MEAFPRPFKGLGLLRSRSQCNTMRSSLADLKHLGSVLTMTRASCSTDEWPFVGPLQHRAPAYMGQLLLPRLIIAKDEAADPIPLWLLIEDA
jgi:hypothetical protein